MSDPGEKAPHNTPVEAFEELAKGPLPEPFVQHYAAAFMAYWGMSAEAPGMPGEPPPTEVTGQ